MKNKKITLTFTLISIFLLTVSSASATYEGLIYSFNSGTTTYAYLAEIQPSLTNHPSCYVEKVVNTVWQTNLTKVALELKETGNPTLGIKACVLDSARTTWLATSTNTITAAELTTSFVWHNFTFAGNLTLMMGETYYIGAYVVSGGGGDGTHYISINSTNTGSNFVYLQYSTDGTLPNSILRANNYWFNMKVYGNDYLVAPTATPYPGGNYWDNQAGQAGNTGYAWLSNTLPFFVPLILILICGFLGYKFGGQWGFMAGLNLGVILTYVIMPTYMPLWGVIVMVLADAILLFGKVGRRE